MKKVKFGDVVKEVKINIDRSNNPYEYYVAGDHMDSEDLTIRRKGRFATDDVGPAFTRLFKPGQILYGSRRTYLKKVAVADFEGICSNTTFVLETADESILRQRLLPFIMLTEDFTKWSISKSKGSTNPYILFSDLANYEFDLPTIEEQDKLTELLWQGYETKESYNSMIKAIDEMVKSQFIDETKKWNTRTTIGGLVENDIAKAGKSYTPDSVIKYIDISSVDNSTNTITGTTEFIFKEAPSRAQQCIETGDILVSTVRPNLKNIAVNHLTDSNLVASSGFCVLRPKEGYTGLLLAYILSDEFTERMSLVAKGTNYPAVHDSDILDYEVTIPQGEEIGKIDALYKQADKSKFELKQSIKKVDKVMRALMQ